jgi:hypothetical protein
VLLVGWGLLGVVWWHLEFGGAVVIESGDFIRQIGKSI